MQDDDANAHTDAPDEPDDPGIVKRSAAVLTGSSRVRRLEMLAAAIMAMAAIGTAWVSYESSRWGTVQTANFNMSNSSRVASTKASSAAGQLAQVDIALFTQAVNAFAAGNEELFQFYVDRAREEFKPALDAWLAADPANNPEAPLTPFELPEYRSAQAEAAEELELAAEENTAVAAQANQRSDNYILAAVVFAAILFLGGIGARLKSDWIRNALLIVTTVGFVANSIWVATFPVILKI